MMLRADSAVCSNGPPKTKANAPLKTLLDTLYSHRSPRTESVVACQATNGKRRAIIQYGESSTAPKRKEDVRVVTIWE